MHGMYQHMISSRSYERMLSKELSKTEVTSPKLGSEPGGIGVVLSRCGRQSPSELNFVDTAESYGTEEVVGEAIMGVRDKVFLATSARHFRRLEVIRSAEQSLKRLGTDYIDLYQLHWPNYHVPIGRPWLPWRSWWRAVNSLHWSQ